MQHLPSWNPLIRVVTSYRAVDTALHVHQWGSKHLKKAFTATSLSSFWHSHYFLLHLVIFTYWFKNAEIVSLGERAWGRGSTEQHCPLVYSGIRGAPGLTFVLSAHQKGYTPSPRLFKTSGARKQGRRGERDVKVRATHSSLSFLGVSC